MEASAVADALSIARPKPERPALGVFMGVGIEIHLVGIRGVGLDRVRPEGKPAWAVMAGLAGALDPRLNIGDVIVEGGPDVTLPGRVTRGRIAAGDALVTTPAAKAELFRSTGAPACEMENRIVRPWAERRGIGFVSIRSISDRADQSLNPLVMTLVDPMGRPKWGKLSATLVRRPRLIPELLNLSADSKTACRSLGIAVREWLLAIHSLPFSPK